MYKTVLFFLLSLCVIMNDRIFHSIRFDSVPFINARMWLFFSMRPVHAPPLCRNRNDDSQKINNNNGRTRLAQLIMDSSRAKRDINASFGSFLLLKRLSQFRRYAFRLRLHHCPSSIFPGTELACIHLKVTPCTARCYDQGRVER